MVSGQNPSIALQTILDGCISQKRESQSLLYARFYGYAFTICKRYVSNDAEMLEVINDGFLKIFHEIRHFKPQQLSLENAFKAWIRRIFINSSIDQLRRRKMKTVWFEQTETQDWLSVPAQGLDRLSHQELLDMVARLSPAYRLVFNLFAIDGCSHEEIASMLGISVGASKSNLARARVNLQKMIQSAKPEHLNHGQRAVDYIDKPFRDAAEQAAGPAMPPEAWDAMEKLLDKRKRRRFGFIPWWTAGIVAGGLALTFALWPGARRGSFTGNKNENNIQPVSAENAKVGIVTVTDKRKEQINTAPDTTAVNGGNHAATASLSPDGNIAADNLRPQRNEKDKTGNGSPITAGIKNMDQPGQKAKQHKEQQISAGRPAPEKANPLLTRFEGEKWTSLLSTAENQRNPDHYLTDNRQGVTTDFGTAGALSKKSQPAIHFPDRPAGKKDTHETPTRGAYLLAMAGMEKSFVAGDRMGNLQPGAQFAIGYQVAPRWYLQTGLSLYKKKYGADPEYYYVEPGSYYSWPGIELKWIDASCEVLEWNIALRYDVYRKKSGKIFAIGGIVSSQMKQEVYDYDYVKYGTPTKARHEYQTGKFVFANSVFAGAGFEKQLNHHFSFQAATSVNIPVRGVGEGRVKLGAANISAGIRYQLPF